MSPEDVPDELLSLYGRNYSGNNHQEAKRRALAAVLAEHERQVRAKVAAETARAFAPLDPAGDYGDYDQGVLDAITAIRARIPESEPSLLTREQILAAIDEAERGGA